MSRRKSSKPTTPFPNDTPFPNGAASSLPGAEDESRFRDIADLSADWVWETDAEGHYTYSSERITQVLGYTVEELLGMTPFDLMQVDEAAWGRHVFLGSAAEKRPIVNLDNIKIHKDGRALHLRTNAVPVLDDEGNLLGYRGIDKVVSERKASQQMWFDDRMMGQEPLAFLRQILDINPNFVFVRDREGRFVVANRAIAEAYGTTIEDLIGKTDADFNARPEEVDAILRSDLEVLDSSQEKFVPESLITYGGTRERWVQTIKRPLLDENGIAQWVLGVSSDITKRKLMELAIQESLERRGRQVQTSTEVAQEIAAAPALDELFLRVVTLVKERFGYYHAQIFRYDPASHAMRLVVGYGEVGEDMLAAGHHLPMGRGVVGTAAATGRPVLASDVTRDMDWVPNTFLPKTQGELAVPIKLRDKILGILDVQSDSAGALTAEDQLLLEGLCGQIAIAIESTQSFESTSTFRQVIEASGQGVVLTTLGGTITYANAMLCRLLDETGPEALIGKSLLSCYPEETGQRLQHEILPSVIRDGHWQGELALLSTTGTLTPTWENMFVVRDRDGSPRYLANQVTDITELKRAEEQLRENEIRYRALFEQANDAIFVEDEDERIIDVNQRACELFGYTRDELLTMRTSDLQPDSAQSLPIYSDPESGIESFQLKAARRDGTPIVIEVTISSLHVGERKLFLSTVRDVTERVHTEDALAQERHLLQTLMENIPDHIYFKDAEGHFIRVNKAMANRLGLDDPAQVVGKTDFDFFSEGHAQQAYEDEVRVMQSGQPLLNVEEKETWLDGRETWVSTTKLPLHDEAGEVAGTFGVSRDTTERRQLVDSLASQAEQLQRALDDTAALYRVSHTINTATTLDEVLHVLMENVAMPDVARASFNLFERPWDLDAPPEYAEPVAVWDQRIESGEMAAIETGLRFDLRKHAAMQCFLPDEPLVFKDINTDPRVDDATRALFRDVFMAPSVAFVPLVAGGQCIGFLCLMLRKVVDLNASDLRRLMTLSAQAAAVVQNLRLLERTQQQLTDMATLQETTSALAASQTFDEAVAELLPRVADAVQANQVSMFLVDEVQMTRIGTYPADLSQGALVGRSYLLADFPLTQKTIEMRQPVVVTGDDDRLQEHARQSFKAAGITANATIPLVGREGVMGTLTVSLKAPKPAFDNHEIRLLQTLADQTTLTFENLRLLEQTRGRARQQEALNEMTAVISSAEDLDDLVARLPAIVEPMRRLVPVDEVALTAYIPGEAECMLFSVLADEKGQYFAQPGERIALEGTASGWVIAHREPLLDADMRQLAHAFSGDERLLAEGLLSRMIMPLQLREQVVGTLNMGSSRVDAFTPEHQILLGQVTHQLAQILERSRLLEATQAAAAEAAATHRSYLRREWQDYLQKEQALSQATFVYDQQAVSTAVDFRRPEIERTLEQGNLVALEGDGGRSGLAIPIEVRGQILGVLGFEDPTGEWRWSSEQLALIQTVTQQLGQALENARLIETTQSLAERERLLGEIAGRVREELEIERVLKAAVDKIQQALDLEKVEVRMVTQEISS